MFLVAINSLLVYINFFSSTFSPHNIFHH